MKRYHAIAIGLIAVGIAAVAGCTDTTQASFSAYGKPHEITVYQRDSVIYHGWSTGKVQQDQHSIQFEDKETREYVDISLGMSATVVTKVKGD